MTIRRPSHVRTNYFFATSIILLAQLFVPAALAHGGTFTVCQDAGCPFTSIQAAVDAVPVGSTLLVAPGHYSESVHISKPLTINGPGLYQGALNRTLDEAVLVSQTEPGGECGALSVEAQDVTLQGLTIESAGSGCEGIRVGSEGTALGIYQNIIHGGQAAIALTDAYNLHINGNKITGAQTAVSARNSTALSFNNNYLTDNETVFSMVNVRDAAINKATVDGSGTALSLSSSGDVTAEMLSGSVSGSAVVARDVDNFSLSNSTFSGRGTGDGVALSGQLSNGVRTTGNTLSGFQSGIVIDDATTPDMVYIRGNNLEGNVENGLRVGPGIDQSFIVASRNWWGGKNGPGIGGNAAAFGVSVSDWCLESMCQTFGSDPRTEPTPELVQPDGITNAGTTGHDSAVQTQEQSAGQDQAPVTTIGAAENVIADSLASAGSRATSTINDDVSQIAILPATAGNLVAAVLLNSWWVVAGVVFAAILYATMRRLLL